VTSGDQLTIVGSALGGAIVALAIALVRTRERVARLEERMSILIEHIGEKWLGD
jgi:hypothetical protein